MTKCDICHCHSLKSETGSWEEIRFLGPTLTLVEGKKMETKKREKLVEKFFGRGISGAALLPYNLVPINWLWSGFIFPDLEHL